MKPGGKKYIAKNKKATFDYFVLSTYEAGIALYGTEIKSIRKGGVNLKDSYCEFKDRELFVRGCISHLMSRGISSIAIRSGLKNCCFISVKS